MSPALSARCLVPGAGQGRLLHTDMPLSFWGGIDAQSGEVMDRHHPLCGQNVAGKVLAIPHGRGSCTGSSVLLELIMNGHAPAALVFEQADDILSLGAMVASAFFERSLAVVCLDPHGYAALRDWQQVRVVGDQVLCLDHEIHESHESHATTLSLLPAAPAPDDRALEAFVATLDLSAEDRAMLDGRRGKAASIAMQIILRMAALQGATALVDVSRAHIDCCIYTGPSSLRLARQLVEWGAQVRVPTTLNAISVDRLGWRALGVAPDVAEPAAALADAFVEMGAQASFTCAPYLLAEPPACGEQIAWAESNAVAYANSVLGARTSKYADYLDILVALTGRAPLDGCHRSADRKAQGVIRMPAGLTALDDAAWALLGYHVGLLADSRIPVVAGLEHTRPSSDDLKGFSAAFATTASAPMFHIVGITPEAASLEAALGGAGRQFDIQVTPADLLGAWQELNSAQRAEIDLVALGNPHFSTTEFAALAALCRGRQKHPDVAVVVTCGRDVLARARAAGDIAPIEAFGVQVVSDTCWCMIGEPVIPPTARTLMTNSGKYAHYGPGLVGRPVHFAALSECIDAACNGRASGRRPAWLVALLGVVAEA